MRRRQSLTWRVATIRVCCLAPDMWANIGIAAPINIGNARPRLLSRRGTSACQKRESIEPRRGAELDSDRPIINPADDRLGFASVAKGLASALLSRTTRDGFVVGIEGPWGSGKSSIVNLLAKAVDTSRASVIPFNPWLIGRRDQLLMQLIAALAHEVTANHKSSPAGAKVDVKKAKAIGEKLRAYGAALARGVSPLAELAGIAGVLGASLAASGLEVAAKTLEAVKSEKNILDLKDELIKDLRELDRKFIVTIDDIDRLEPAEAVEIVRLVRAIGDFPNVIYLIAYDAPVLANSLATALGLQDGPAFLEKIVQVSFRVPHPELFDLRRWLHQESLALYADVLSAPLGADELDRLAYLTDTYGGLVRTPRDVTRILNALRLYYPPVAGLVDYVDMCWLQVIRLKRSDLYDWLEGYLADFAALRNGAVISESGRKRIGAKLQELLPDDDASSVGSIWPAMEYIPGLSGNADPAKTAFDIELPRKITALEIGRRLGSPSHFRLYFSFAAPAGTLDDALFAKLTSGSLDQKSLTRELERLVQKIRPQGGSAFDQFLDRANRTPSNMFGPGALATLSSVLANMADKAQASEPERGLSGKTSWRYARQFFEKTLKTLNEPERERLISQVFRNGRSLGWLLADVIGYDLFAHGLVEAASTSGRTPILTRPELELAVKLVFDRLKGGDRKRILSVPELLSFMYRWHQAGGASDLADWIAEELKELMLVS